MCRKIAVLKSLKADTVRQCSFVVLEVCGVKFYEMADIEML